MTRSGTSPRATSLKKMLRRQAPDLEIGGNRRAELDDVVIEEGDAHLERMRHRDVVEVMEQCVDERRAGRRDRACRRAARRRVPRLRADALARAAPSSAPASGPRAASLRSSASSRPLIARWRSTRVVARQASRTGRSERSRARRGRERRPCRAAGLAQSSASARPARRRGAFVAAEKLVGALPGKRDGHAAARRTPRARRSRGRDVAERLVEVPDELGEVDRVVAERELELVVVGSERLAT